MGRTAKIVGGVVVIVAVGLVAGGVWLWDQFHVSLPDYSPIEKTKWLDQNWTDEQRQWFHHADQGTLTFGIPYEWFVALEQPSVSFAGLDLLKLKAPGLLADASYLDRYGFIPGSTEPGSHELPVGFARGGPIPDYAGAPRMNPQTKKDMAAVGLTCAACHTGRFTYHNTTVLIDGGPALTALDKFKKGLGLSLFFTRHLPFRFDRFAERVLGPGAGKDAKSELLAQLDAVLENVKTIKSLDDKVSDRSVEEGYARLDALNRIGNTVFALDAGHLENYVGTSAPVHFPRIWNAYWFDWVQYNGSIQQPMIRNAGEAIGVSAPINLRGPQQALFTSRVQVQTVFEMEGLLAGQQPSAKSGFSGLKSPKWPTDVLPPIDEKLRAEGEKLYASLCQDCHLPPVGSDAFWSSKRWLPANSAGESYLDLEMIDVHHIGTDPAQAEDMKSRTLAIPAGLGITTSAFGPALGQLVEKTVKRWYESQQPPTPDARRDEMNGHRPNGIRDAIKYKARPLNGIWATPPYLHNGSVPTLYALLSPVLERPPTFQLGQREYDPIKVGYRSDELAGGFTFDTRIRGNHNTGHEFDDRKADGVIGRRLGPDERRALVEYLKTL